MTNIKIVLDSSADLNELTGIDFASAPLKIIADGKQYVDDAELDVGEMVDFLYTYKGRSATSCPNTEDWLRAFGDAERIFSITITSNLSGSYNAARVAKDEYERLYPERKVELIDSLSTGPEIALMAEKIRELAVADKSFEEITEYMKGYKTELLFVLESMNNLANNGRISRVKATLASFLGIRAIGRASDEGTLEMLTKCRGEAKTVDAFSAYLAEFGFKGGKISIAHCQNEKLAAAFSAAILAAYPGADISVRECRGLCSFYAERGGVLVGYEV